MGVSCPQLQAINLENSTGVDDSSIASLADNCAELQVLKIDGCHKITDSGLACLQKCEKLIKCSATRLPEVTGRPLQYLSTELTELDLSDCGNVTDEVMDAVCKNCKKLELIAIKRLSSTLSDATIRAIYTNCPALHTLEISGNTRITSRAMLTMASKLIHLTSLSVAGIPTVDDSIVTTFARNFKKLTRLDCRQCVLISNMGVVQLANEAQSLKELFLSGCTAISDESGDAFETGFHKLNYLNIHGCTGLSQDQIMRIVSACLQL